MSACGKGHVSTAAGESPSSAPIDGGLAAGEGGPPAEEPRLAALWEQAVDGGADDLARLEAAVGSEGVTASYPYARRRLTALRSLAYAEDLDSFPFLATAATSGTDDEASASLDSVALLLARPRRATDPEDALQVREGCARLVALAKDAARSRSRRIRAVGVLRAAADRGWVRRGDIPSDLDGR